MNTNNTSAEVKPYVSRMEAIARRISPGLFWDDADYDEAWGWKSDAILNAAIILDADPLTAVVADMAKAMEATLMHLEYKRIYAQTKRAVMDVNRDIKAVKQALSSYKQLKEGQS
jgi:hypothetical protein